MIPQSVLLSLGCYSFGGSFVFLYEFKFFALVLSLVIDRDYLESIDCNGFFWLLLSC